MDSQKGQGVTNIVVPIIILFLFISLGCNNSNPTETSLEVGKKNSDTAETDFTCLELSFIEDLESSWESSYKDNSLPLKGFVRIQSNAVENGQEIAFENKQLNNHLTISKFEYADGDELFQVEYVVQPEQINCIEEQLKANNYVIDEDDYKHFHQRDRYIKNDQDGSGSKYIHIEKDKELISYYHSLD